MKLNVIDQAIFQALNFSNAILLEKCFSFIGLKDFVPKIHLEPKRKKFEKVTLQSKIKDQKIRNQISDQNADFKSPLHLQTPKPQIKIKNYGERSNRSDFSINELYRIIDAKEGQNYEKQVYRQERTAYKQEYSIQALLKQTQVHIHPNFQSPISEWKSNSPEKYDKTLHENFFNPEPSKSAPKRFKDKESSKVTHQHFEERSLKKSGFQQFSRGSNKTTVSKLKNNKNCEEWRPKQSVFVNNTMKKKKKKFQKPYQKPNQGNQNSAVQFDINFQSKSDKSQQKFREFQDNYRADETNQKQVLRREEKSKSDSETQTRATCDLEKSKLQKIMEVEGNKYKQIILKSFYKCKK